MRGTHVRHKSPTTPANLWRKLGRPLIVAGTFSRDPKYMAHCNTNFVKKHARG